jgi:uncharacterized RDD family membrane protein YckC
MEWYYAEDGKQVGPLTDADFNRLVGEGKIAPDTLVWRAGLENWIPCAQARAGAAPAPAAAGATAPCAECGKEFAREDMVSFKDAWVCAACKPVFFQRVKEGGALPGVMEYAGFWIRFAAKFVDGILLGVVNALIGFVAGLAAAGALAKPARGEMSAAFLVFQVALWIVQILLAMGYNTWFVGKYGATPGKMACKLRVVRPDGEPLTYGRACGRYFAEMVSSITLGIGYLMVVWDEEKRALHDRICDTRVIRNP